MSNFHINNSKVEQISNEGDNYKITGNKGTIGVTQQDGQTTQTTGNENTVKVNEKGNWLASLMKKVKGWFMGWFTGG